MTVTSKWCANPKPATTTTYLNSLSFINPESILDPSRHTSKVLQLSIKASAGLSISFRKCKAWLQLSWTINTPSNRCVGTRTMNLHGDTNVEYQRKLHDLYSTTRTVANSKTMSELVRISFFSVLRLSLHAKCSPTSQIVKYPSSMRGWHCCNLQCLVQDHWISRSQKSAKPKSSDGLHGKR